MFRREADLRAFQTVRQIKARGPTTLQQRQRPRCQAGRHDAHARQAERHVAGACGDGAGSPGAFQASLSFRSSSIEIPWLFNCKNGTLDLRTGELRPHRREDYLTKSAPVAYDADAKAPLWEKFLADIMGGDDELVALPPARRRLRDDRLR